MNYKLLLYVFDIMLCLFVLNGLNINHLFKQNKVIESRLLIMIIAFIMAYLLTNFIFDFLEVSAIF